MRSATQPSSGQSDVVSDIIIARKRSAIERHGSALPKHQKSHAALMHVVDGLTNLLAKMGLTSSVVTLDELMNGSYDFYKAAGADRLHLLHSRSQLIISVGGDGTLLHASHFLGGQTKLMGINAVPKASVGHLCLAKDSNFEISVNRALEGRLTPKRLQRLEVSKAVFAGNDDDSKAAPETLDPQLGESLPLALNDVLFCNSHPAATSRYEISVSLTGQPESGSNRTVCSEDHVSSGVWISTAAGSTAAISSYGLQRLPLESARFLIAVREPYFRPESFCTLTRASLDGREQCLTIVSHMTSAIVAVDGADFSQQIKRSEGVSLSMVPENELLLYI
jgi:NAD+ kinase